MSLNHSAHRSKIDHIKSQIKEASDQSHQAYQKNKNALLSAAILSELQGWKEAPPFSSNLIKILKETLPAGLRLQSLSLERYVSIHPLKDARAAQGFPGPVHTLKLSDQAFIYVTEVESGVGARSFPVFIELLDQKTSLPISYERHLKSPLKNGYETVFSQEKSEWILSISQPPIALWINRLEPL